MYEVTFEVSWHGMDHSYNVDEFDTLREAQDHAVMVSELGAQMITVSDSDGLEFEW